MRRCFFCHRGGWRIKQHLTTALRFFVIQPLTFESQWDSLFSCCPWPPCSAKFDHSQRIVDFLYWGYIWKDTKNSQNLLKEKKKKKFSLSPKIVLVQKGYLVRTIKTWNVANEYKNELEIGRRKNFFQLWEVSWVASPVSWEMWESRLGIKQCHIFHFIGGTDFFSDLRASNF